MTATTTYIRHLLMTLVLSIIALGSLSAQTARDSVVAHPLTNGLLEAFDEPMGDDALPQYMQADDDSLSFANDDSIAAWYARELLDDLEEVRRVDTYFERFNPSPAKAVWMSALIPGGGQIYNRKYWKLPIVYGGFLGLLYGYNWNQRYFKTYQNAYRDIKTGSPNASYMSFLPGWTEEAVERQKPYLEETFARKRNTYRNWRDYCVVGMLGVYLVSVVDAYVDAALYHFDVSPELDACNNPTMMVSYKIDF